MASDAAPAVTVLIAGFIHEATGIDPREIADVVVVYTTVRDQIGLLTYVCCPSHAMTMMGSGIDILAEGSPPDLHIPCN